MNLDNVKDFFEEKYDDSPRLFKSPARINLIGGHTDYNDGFALPMAINKYIYFAISASSGDHFELDALNFKERFKLYIGDLEDEENSFAWVGYLKACLIELKAAGHDIQGANIVFGGDIPVGAGISSSAALTCGFLFALNELFNYKLSILDIGLIAQKAEHRVGVMCGIMDQYAILFSQLDKVILLDCLNMTHSYHDANIGDYVWVLYQSNVKRALSDSEFNKRATTCNEGFEKILEKDKTLKSKQAVTLDILEQHKADLSSLEYKRLHYIVSENVRVDQAAKFLAEGNLKAFGELLYQTHEGLKSAYEISCKELDFIVNFTKNCEEVLGARLVGGGFGGCVLALVHEEGIDKVYNELSGLYFAKFFLQLDQIVASSSAGVVEI